MPRVVGYNVQTAVEAEHHLIVAHGAEILGQKTKFIMTRETTRKITVMIPPLFTKSVTL
jgi:hypothetical protein